MGEMNNDDAGSDFGDDLQYDFITPNFQSRYKSSPFVSLKDISQNPDRQVKSMKYLTRDYIISNLDLK